MLQRPAIRDAALRGGQGSMFLADHPVKDCTTRASSHVGHEPGVFLRRGQARGLNSRTALEQSRAVIFEEALAPIRGCALRSPEAVVAQISQGTVRVLASFACVVGGGAASRTCRSAYLGPLVANPWYSRAYDGSSGQYRKSVSA